MGRIPVVCLYVWTPTHGGGGFGAVVEKPKNDTPMVFTVLDPATGKMSNEKGPDWGSPESRPFWKPVMDGMRERLAARGMEKSAALGFLNDRVPSKQCIEDMAAAAPEANWIMYAHGRGYSFAGKPLAMDCCVWGIRGPLLVGDQFHKWAWKNKPPTTVFPRYGAGAMGHVRNVSHVGLYHALIEGYIGSGYSGVGNVGADFWPVVKDDKGRLKGTVMSRFPTWQRPGEPTMCNGAFLFPGEKEPIATVRFEALRLGVQEAEARIAIEKAVEDKAKRAKLGEDLAKRAIQLLDDRVKGIIRAKQDTSDMYSLGSDASWADYAQGWPERTRQLYRLAADVSKTLNKQ
jgi:hypothetical protein